MHVRKAKGAGHGFQCYGEIFCWVAQLKFNSNAIYNLLQTLYLVKFRKQQRFGTYSYLRPGLFQIIVYIYNMYIHM